MSPPSHVLIPVAILQTGCLYQLVAVVQHEGVHRDHGHYVATVWSERDRHWYRTDDSSVIPLRTGDHRPPDAYMVCRCVPTPMRSLTHTHTHTHTHTALLYPSGDGWRGRGGVAGLSRWCLVPTTSGISTSSCSCSCSCFPGPLSYSFLRSAPRALCSSSPSESPNPQGQRRPGAETFKTNRCVDTVCCV